jgi:hypothetical protein
MDFNPLILLIAGGILFFTPPKILLKFDRKSGYAVYKQKLNSTHDEELALKAAGSFYKLFGVACSLFGVFFFILLNLARNL